MAFHLGRRGFIATPLAAYQTTAAAQQKVVAMGDGISLEPEQYGLLLAELGRDGNAEPDNYSRGGVVARLEKIMAERLGKEMAVWLPTGTLANHLAVRLLAGSKRRVAVQAESHLYSDCGDCAQTLSGLTLIPLAKGSATFTLAQLQSAAEDAEGGRVLAPIGAVQMETPVRRRFGERFDFGEMTKISSWARAHGVGLHLDGARLFIEAAYTGRGVGEYAALFDTVYVSMYKYFNAAGGAILAGPRQLLESLYHTRRMFGGGVYESWPSAAVALHFLDGFESRFQRAVKSSEQVIPELTRSGHFEIERVPDGTNIFYLKTTGVNAPIYQQRLLRAGVTAMAEGARIRFQVNETWNRLPAEEIVRRFLTAVAYD